MIRINLVAPERKSKAKDKGPALPAGALQSYLLLALFAGGALVLCAGAWWLQSNKLRDLETRIAADEKRQKDLEAIRQQVDQFQQKKALLENKVLVIEQLRLAQKSPVHMLDEVSKALPDYVWLTALDENRGAMRFTGQSNSLAAVADFISGLQRSGWFPQVDLGSSQQSSQAQTANLVNFTLTGTFRDPEVAAKEKAAAEAKAAAAPPPPAKAARGRKK
jgi:type IV pilus assembly protein PilN